MIFKINLETGHGALSVDFKGSYSGFYAKEGQTWLISRNKRKPYSQYSPYEYVKSCNKEYHAAPHDLHYVPQMTSNDLEKPSKRLRREVEDKYIETLLSSQMDWLENMSPKMPPIKPPVYAQFFIGTNLFTRSSIIFTKWLVFA